MADLNTVIDAANALFMTVPGMKRAFQYAKNVGPSADLPCVIPIASRLEHSAQANGYQRKDYTIRYLLLVTPLNKDLEKMDKQARPFGDLVADVFFPHVKLNSSAIDHAQLTIGEYAEINYNEADKYIGWTFTLTATIKTPLEQGY